MEGGESASLPAGKSVSITVIRGPDTGIKHEFSASKVVLGRKRGDVILKDRETSSLHASIEVAPDGRFILKDLGSTNGTFLDGRRVTVAEIASGQQIRIGANHLLFTVALENPGDTTRHSLTEVTGQNLQAVREPWPSAPPSAADDPFGTPLDPPTVASRPRTPPPGPIADPFTATPAPPSRLPQAAAPAAPGGGAWPAPPPAADTAAPPAGGRPAPPPLPAGGRGGQLPPFPSAPGQVLAAPVPQPADPLSRTVPGAGARGLPAPKGAAAPPGGQPAPKPAAAPPAHAAPAPASAARPADPLLAGSPLGGLTAPRPAPSPALGEPLPAGVERSVYGVYLVVERGRDKGRVFPVNRQVTVLGRSGTEVLINDPDISRRHAALDVQGESKYILRDLASTNGTLLNGVRIQTEMISDNDKIRLGATTIKLIVGEARVAAELRRIGSEPG